MVLLDYWAPPVYQIYIVHIDEYAMTVEEMVHAAFLSQSPNSECHPLGYISLAILSMLFKNCECYLLLSRHCPMNDGNNSKRKQK
jgi:hypothetical protein